MVGSPTNYFVIPNLCYVEVDCDKILTVNLYLYYSNSDYDKAPHGKSLASKMLLLLKRPGEYLV